MINANYSEALEQQIRFLNWAFGEDMPADRSDRKAVQQSLTYADPFYVSPAICGLLEATSKSYPNTPLSDKDLPTTHGFAWFAKPLSLPPDPYPTYEPMALVAAAWIPATFSDSTGIAASFFTESGTRISGFGFGRWAWGDGWRDFNPVIHIDGLDSDDIRGKQHIQTQRRYLSAFFSFISQRILVTRASLVERHVRKRVESLGWTRQSIVRIVELRQRELRKGSAPVEAIEREWSCQWVVRGHWRQQPYPKVGAVRPKWITPYIKGPEGKPLKPPRATVFAVVR